MAGAPSQAVASGGEAASSQPSGGEAGSSEEGEAAAVTEERMDAAAPEQADADAMVEMDEDPEAQSSGAIEEVADTPTGSAASDAETQLLPSSISSATQTGDEISAPSPNASAPEPVAEGSPNSSEGAASGQAPSASGAPEVEASPSSAGGALESGEQQAALSSLAEPSGGGAVPGGGGGGGAAIAEPPAPEIPDVAGQEPEAALAQVQHLPPAAMQQALGGVTQCVESSVAVQRSEQQANPPEMERPSGSPVIREGPAGRTGEDSEVAAQSNVERAPTGPAVPTAQPEPLPAVPPTPTNAVPGPQVTTPSGSQVNAEDAREVQSSVRRLPVSDPGLEVPSAPPPTVALEGDADPSQTREQNAHLQESLADAQAQGRQDAARPMGEHEIYPTVPQETLRAQTTSGAAAGGAPGSSSPASAGSGGGAPGGSSADEAASIVAQEQHGEEIRSAAAQARSEMAARRQDHSRQVSEERASNRRQMAEFEHENASQQAQERNRARRDVQQARGEWSEAQQQEVDRANEEATRETSGSNEQIGQEQSQADQESARHIGSGQQEAQGHRERAETQASQARSEAEQESDGVFGWLASRARAFFDRIKRGITAIFDAARRLVRAAIERARQLAVAVIERARRAIVGIIRAVGAALIAIGDRVLAAFPRLRARFRRFIEQRVAAAEAAVNRLADALKAGVQRLLNLLGAALDAALGLLQRGLLAAVNAANAVVQRAIRAARAVVQAFAGFMALIRDVAAGPGRWIRNLAAAVVDGIRNHLWRAFREAVRNWFNSKLEEVLGIGGMIWGVLRRGGIQIAGLGAMVWEGLKSAIPIALVTILVEKLVAMIVPAAAAVMAIIEGLQAAWGTVSRVITAFSRFFAFLRAVRSGNAGPPFASALAAAAVVVIDFVANWLIRRIRRPAGRIAGRIRALAQRILQRLRRVGRRAGGAVRRAGRRIAGAVRGARDRFRAWRNRRRNRRQDPGQRARDRERANRQRLERAAQAIRPQLHRLLSRGVSVRRLNLQLAFWRVRYRLTRLAVEGSRVVAVINPNVDLDQIRRIPPRQLGAALQSVLAQVEAEFFRIQEQQRSEFDLRRVSEAERATAGGTRDFLGLSTAEQVEHFRRIQGGRVLLPPPERILNSRPGGREFRSPIIRPGEPGFSTYGNRDAMGRPRLSGFYTIGAGAYPMPADVLAAPSRRGLVHVLEPARGEGAGLFAASQVTQGLVERNAISELEAFSGSHAPMAAAGSAATMEIDQGLRPAGANPAEERAARTHRLHALRRIFITLAESLRNPPVELIADSAEQAALQDVARAFLDWGRANFTRRVIDPQDAAATAAEFRAKLLIFLQTMNLR